MENGTKKTAVIIDTDPGVDDIIAILLAIASPELEILAFIITYGNADRDACYNNILKTYQLIARHLEAHPSDRARFPNFHQDRKPILARGACSPLEGPQHRATYFHGSDGLSDISTRYPEFNIESSVGQPHPQLELSDRPGVDVVLDLIRDCPTKTVTYIALGPLTTLAQIARRDAMLLHDRIGQVVCMGGALDVPGNVSPVAEFNFYADPFAVRELLLPAEDEKTGLPLDRFLLASLDITTSHVLPFPSYQRLVDSSFCAQPSIQGNKTPLAHFTSSFLERTRGIMQQFGKDAMELHDIVAVWYAIDNPPNSPLHKGWAVNQRKFDIERTGKLTRGMLVVDRRNDTTAYPPGTNRSRVQAELDRQGISHGFWESPAVPAPVEVESVIDTVTVGAGVSYIAGTPGNRALLQLLFERIWGISTIQILLDYN